MFVAIAILLPNAALMTLSAFLTGIAGVITWAGMDNRKTALLEREKCRQVLNELGKIVGDHKTELLDPTKKYAFGIDRTELTNLVNFFFPQK